MIGPPANRILLRTPAPLSDESPFGYLLRTSESNGYTTPYIFLSFAGFTQDEIFKPRIDAVRLASVLGTGPEVLKHIGYAASNLPGRGALEICGHPVPAGAIRLRNPAFCPVCVQERGHIEALWDLQHLTACPRHGCKVLTRCDRCGADLSWFRRGLLVCRCGADLRAQKPSVARGVDVDLARVLVAKLTMQTAVPGEARLPAEDLAKMPLGHLLHFLRKLSRFNAQSLGLDPPSSAVGEVHGAADVLENWPNNLFEMLSRLGERHPQDALGLRGQFGPFFDAMFRSALDRSQLTFVHNAFIEFGLRHWGKALVDRKLTARDPSARVDAVFLSQSQVARRHGINPHLLRRIRAHNLVSRTEVCVGGATTVIMDAENAARVARDSKKVIARRWAAASLGIPESVLQCLRLKGVFRARPLPRAASIYHQEDVSAFADLLDGLPVFDGSGEAEAIVTLQSVLQHGRTPVDLRVSIVESVLSGAIPIRRRSGLGTSNIWIDEIHLQAARSTAQLRPSHGSFSAAQASKAIGCDPMVVSQLAELGFLQSAIVSDQRKYDAASVNGFADRYVSVATQARLLSTSARALGRFCKLNDIRLLTVSRLTTQIPQSFVERKDLPRLSVDTCSRRPRRHLIASTSPHPV